MGECLKGAELKLGQVEVEGWIYEGDIIIETFPEQMNCDFQYHATDGSCNQLKKE